MITSDSDVIEIIQNRLSASNITSKEKEILEIISKLLNYYSFVENQTYPRPNHPDPSKRKDAYFTLIAILLSLRTTLENEIRAVNNFCERYSNIFEVAEAEIVELEELIKCAGMPKKKAETIINVSKYIIKNFDGDINNINDNDIDQIKHKLFEIPGLGEKSVDCMLELAFDLPSIVIDINVFRVFSRLYFAKDNMSFENKKDILKIKEYIETNILNDNRLYQIIHTIILLHGKNVCKSTPKCSKCQICDKCQYYTLYSNYNQLKLF